MENELQIQWDNVRALRNRLLAETDYLVVRAYESGQPVAPEVAEYRDQLRNIPQLFQNPADIAWPEPPSA
jgi:hypothetical protein